MAVHWYLRLEYKKLRTSLFYLIHNQIVIAFDEYVKQVIITEIPEFS